MRIVRLEEMRQHLDRGVPPLLVIDIIPLGGPLLVIDLVASVLLMQRREEHWRAGRQPKRL